MNTCLLKQQVVTRAKSEMSKGFVQFMQNKSKNYYFLFYFGFFFVRNMIKPRSLLELINKALCVCFWVVGN